MTPLIGMLLESLAFVMAAMTGLWLLSLARRDASIVDPFWGTGFILVTWLTLASAGPAKADARSWLLVILVTIWGARLSLYLLWRNRGHGEDKRYRAMREHHGSRFWWISLLTVFCSRESFCGSFRCRFRQRLFRHGISRLSSATVRIATGLAGSGRSERMVHRSVF